MLTDGFPITDSMRNEQHYTGVTRKFGVTIDGENYIVKFPKSGLISQVYSEYVSSRFICNIGVPCQDVWLGFYKDQLVVIIKDFKKEGEALHAFKDTRQSSEDTSLSMREYTYADVIHLIETHTKLQPAMRPAMIKQFWEQFMCDAILGNRDRHSGNWGYLSTPNGYVPAPVFDNGGSLFPDIETRIYDYAENRFQFLAERAEKFPASLFKIALPDGTFRRTNYYEVCGQVKLPELTLQRVMDAIEKATAYVMEPYKEFYRSIVCVRFLHIIKRLSMEEAYEQLQNYENRTY
jgi:hypothetical protein